MDYNPPRNTTPSVADPRPEYFNGDPAAGQKGAIPPALAIEHPQREILTVIENAGLLASAADTTQLWQAIQIMINQGVEARLALVDDGSGGTIGDPGYIEPEAGGVTLLGAYAAQGTYEINLGRADPNRWVVVVVSQFSSAPFPTDIGVPTIDAVAMATAIHRKNGLANDGHRAGVYYKHVPAGETVDLAIAVDYINPRIHVYRMVGVAPGATPVSAVYADGDGVTATHPASGKGAVFAAAVQNFADTPIAGITGCLPALTQPNAATYTDNVAGANRALPASNTYQVTTHSSAIYLTIAVVFEYDA